MLPLIAETLWRGVILWSAVALIAAGPVGYVLWHRRKKPPPPKTDD